MNHRSNCIILLAAFLAACAAMAETPAAPAKPDGPTVNDTHPGMAAGGLTYATLSELPEGVLVRAGSLEITSKDLEAEVGRAPETIKEDLKKNAFFLIEQLATKAVVLAEAKKANPAAASKAEEDLLNEYVQGVVSKAEVSEQEVAKFYEENKDACNGATLEQVKDQMKQYVLQEKQQDMIQEHIRTLGQRVPIAVSAPWAKEQVALAKDNPVDKARASGKPTMVDFGADGCRPCEMMTPILADLVKKYEGKANIVFVHVRQQQVLGSRFGIRAIPVQVFFDKDGKEVFRHTGFYPQAEIEKKLAELGAV